MEETALLIQEHNLEWLELLCQFTRGNVGINIQDLSRLGFGQASENRECACTDGSLKGALVDLCDLSDETVRVLVKVVSSKDSRGDRTCARAQFLEGVDEPEVLLEEDSASNTESFGICGETYFILCIEKNRNR